MTATTQNFCISPPSPQNPAFSRVKIEPAAGLRDRRAPSLSHCVLLSLSFLHSSVMAVAAIHFQLTIPAHWKWAVTHERRQDGRNPGEASCAGCITETIVSMLLRNVPHSGGSRGRRRNSRKVPKIVDKPSILICAKHCDFFIIMARDRASEARFPR
jgi:hypothetical protein